MREWSKNLRLYFPDTNQNEKEFMKKIEKNRSDFLLLILWHRSKEIIEEVGNPAQGAPLAFSQKQNREREWANKSRQKGPLKWRGAGQGAK